MFGLPYRQIWLLDFEFVSESGAVPVPVCMVARELISNRLVRLWQDELGAGPPFPINDDTLFVAYFASAELGCFLALGWPPPNGSWTCTPSSATPQTASHYRVDAAI